ncbi:MAG TPA: XcyI family restriction endonuclease [Bacteroidales bacterium]|nr:XcyI family restriction endonuclease [Bacteroidales bacterium]HPE57901.1 XcyI family restriction endonuclease [Bacteroidales bacterium]HRX97184.1 XcyI family restriction endonuclease [Bacteroidales bacterium]
MSDNYPILSPDLQLSFYYRLKSTKGLFFHESLKQTIKKLEIKDIDSELSKFVTSVSLKKLAELSLRGEAIFPIPSVLRKNPYLLGYYRLLFGFSQKEFYSKGPFGLFKLMEVNGILTNKADFNLDKLCRSLISTADVLVKEMDEFSLSIISELQLLTFGPQLRGSKNNEYGQLATQKTFNIIKELVKNYIISSTPNSIEIKNDSGRNVSIAFSADPDIEITEKLSSEMRGLISIEIKGGRDISNIHNRIGEAEKSHQKAKKRGHIEFMTILNVEIDYKSLRDESPTTSHFFNLDKLWDNNSSEFSRFKDILSSVMSIHL